MAKRVKIAYGAWIINGYCRFCGRKGDIFHDCPDCNYDERGIHPNIDTKMLKKHMDEKEEKRRAFLERCTCCDPAWPYCLCGCIETCSVHSGLPRRVINE